MEDTLNVMRRWTRGRKRGMEDTFPRWEGKTKGMDDTLQSNKGAWGSKRGMEDTLNTMRKRTRGREKGNGGHFLEDAF